MSLLSNIGSITVTASTALSAAAGSLNAGESGIGSSFATPLPTVTMAQGDQFNWQSRWHYDSTRKRAFALGRRQADSSGTTGYAQYDETTNTWTTASFIPPNGTAGHLYDTPAFDRTNGYSYYLVSGGRTDRIARKSISDANVSGSWNWDIGATPLTKGAPSNMLYSSGPNFISDSTGMAYHPNLYGSGQPGLVIGAQFGILGYNITTDTYTAIVDRATWTAAGGSTMTTPSVEYCTGLDAVFFYGGATSSTSAPYYKIAAGPVVTSLNLPPRPLGADRGSVARAYVIDDPNQSTFYVLAYSPGFNAWKYNAGSDSYTAISDHPFTGATQEDFIVCALYGLGAIAALEQTTSGGTTHRWRIWKPSS